MGKKMRVYVRNPIFTIIFEEEEENLTFTTSSIMKAVEFFQDGFKVVMKATKTNSSETLNTKPITKFSVNFRSGKWRVSDSECVYVIAN